MIKKNLLCIAVSTLLLTAPATLLAQQTPGMAIPAIVTNPGTFRTENMNVNDVINTLTKHIDQRQQKQIKMIKDTMKEVETAYNALVMGTPGNPGPVQRLIDDHTRTKLLKNAITLDQFTSFYKSVDDYRNKRQALENRLVNIKMLPNLLSSMEKGFKVDSQNVQYPDYLPKDSHNAIVEQIQKALKAVDDKMNTLTFTFNLEGIALKSLIPWQEIDLARAKQYVHSGELKKMREDAFDRRIEVDSELDKINNPFGVKIFEEMQSFVERWGHNKKWRFSEANDTQFVEDAKRLEEYFFMRSFFRVVFGVPYGSYAIKDTQKVFNLEVIKSSASLMQFTKAGHERNITNLKDAKDAIVNALAVLEMRTRTQKGSLKEAPSNELLTQIGDTFRGEATLLERASSILSIFRGEHGISVSQKVILRMMLTDVNEELALSELGGLQTVKNSFKLRYLGGADAQRYKDLFKAMYGLIKKPSTQTNTESVKGTLNGSIMVFKNISSELAQVLEIERQIDMLERAQKFSDNLDYNNNIDDLDDFLN